MNNFSLKTFISALDLAEINDLKKIICLRKVEVSLGSNSVCNVIENLLIMV